MLKGGNGGDTLQGDKGEDTLVGGNGNDTFVFDANQAGEANADVVEDFQAGATLRKMTFNDSVDLKNVAKNTIEFVQVDDNVELTINGALLATFLNADSQEVAAATNFLGGSPAAVNVRDGDGNIVPVRTSGTDKNDVLGGVPGSDNVIAGNDGNDMLNGKGKSDFLLGGNGNDTLNGANGSDTLFGGRDDDVLDGGNGGDLLNGDFGADTLSGGNGGDTFEFTGRHVGSGVDTVTDFDMSEGDTISLKNFSSSTTDFVENGDNNVDFLVDGELVAVFENVEVSDFLGLSF